MSSDNGRDLLSWIFEDEDRDKNEFEQPEVETRRGVLRTKLSKPIREENLLSEDRSVDDDEKLIIVKEKEIIPESTERALFSDQSKKNIYLEEKPLPTLGENKAKKDSFANRIKGVNSHSAGLRNLERWGCEPEQWCEQVNLLYAAIAAADDAYFEYMHPILAERELEQKEKKRKTK